MFHRLSIIENTKEMVKDTLFEFASYDNDFNGQNGPEYLWEQASAAGFKTNRDYVWSIASEKKDNKDIIETFISIWMNSACYYEDFSIEVMVINEFLFVSLAYIAI